jgi:hypothetical protein
VHCDCQGVDKLNVQQVAKNIGKAGQIMGVALLDFVIIAKNGHNSFYQTLKHDKSLDYVAEHWKKSLLGGLNFCLTSQYSRFLF